MAFPFPQTGNHNFNRIWIIHSELWCIPTFRGLINRCCFPGRSESWFGGRWREWQRGRAGWCLWCSPSELEILFIWFLSRIFSSWTKVQCYGFFLLLISNVGVIVVTVRWCHHSIQGIAFVAVRSRTRGEPRNRQIRISMQSSVFDSARCRRRGELCSVYSLSLVAPKFYPYWAEWVTK